MRWILSAVVLLASTSLAAENYPSTQTLDQRVEDGPAARDLGTRPRGVDWHKFLGPSGDSKSPEAPIITKWAASGPRLVWNMKVGVGYSMPSVSRGRLYQFDRHRDTARLTCLNSETGKAIWKFEYETRFSDQLGYDNGPRCAPVIDGNRVYIYGAEGLLHCVHASNGKMLWRVNTAADFGIVENFFGVGSTPIIEGRLLIAQVGGSPKGSPRLYSGLKIRGNGSGIVAFDKYTGKLQYKITNELASYSSPVTATINKRRWCFVFARGGLVGFEPKSGKVDFQYPWRSPKLESVNAANPIVVDDRVFISETYGPASSLLRVRPKGYDILWKDDLRSCDKSLQLHWNTAIHHDGYVYGSSGRHRGNAELRCIKLSSGKVMWSRPGLTRSSLMMVDGHFVCLSEDGTLRLLKVNPKKYEVVAEVVLVDPKTAAEYKKLGLPPARLLRSPAWAAPILSHGLLYLRGKDQLVCLELIPK